MVLNRVWLAAIGAVAVAWSGLAVSAQPYRPGEFLNLDLSKAVLSPRPLGPAMGFSPGPLDVTIERGTNDAAHTNAESVADPRIVAAESVHAESASMANAAPANRAIAPHRRVAQARADRPATRKPHMLVALHGRNPVEAHAQDMGNHTRIQVWPCKSGGICNWKR
jgi:hypothetical protein